MSTNDLLGELNHLSAAAAIVVAAILTYGFVRLSVNCQGMVRYLAIGLLLMHLVVFLRTVYWHLASYILPTWKWPIITESSFGAAMHLMFNLLVVIAGFFSLKALWLAIPYPARKDYTLLGAAFYPRGRSIFRVLRALGSKGARRK